MARHENFRGILMMLFAMGLLSCMDAGLKLLSAHYPPLQVTALRGLASLPLVAVWACWTVGARALLRVRWGLQLARGALGVATLTVFVYGIRALPLTTAYTLFFVAPLIITALSALVLRERVGPSRWVAIAAGFGGVLVALRPTGEGALTWAGLAVLAAALGYAVAAVLVRVLGRTDSTQSMVFWMLLIMTLGAAALAAPGWVAIDPRHAPLIAAVGVVGALGQYALTEAFARGEASVIAPFEYSALAWGLGFDVALWGVLPDGMTWLGAAIIVASGLYILYRERVHHDR
jgi:drug/metabolite transporter (DMT)-like permease